MSLGNYTQSLEGRLHGVGEGREGVELGRGWVMEGSPGLGGDQEWSLPPNPMPSPELWGLTQVSSVLHQLQNWLKSSGRPVGGKCPGAGLGGMLQCWLASHPWVGAQSYSSGFFGLAVEAASWNGLAWLRRAAAPSQKGQRVFVAALGRWGAGAVPAGGSKPLELCSQSWPLPKIAPK